MARQKMSFYLNSLQLNLMESHSKPNGMEEGYGNNQRQEIPQQKNRGSFLSTSTKDSDVNLLSKCRERFVKNNKLVYVHSEKKNSRKVVEKTKIVRKIF